MSRLLKLYQPPGVEQLVVRDCGAFNYIMLLRVDRDRRGRGLGTLAVNLVKLQGKPVKVQALADTPQEQAQLVWWYKRRGFIPVTRPAVPHEMVYYPSQSNIDKPSIPT